MSDLLEHDLRGAFAERAARVTPQASARLLAVDYRPRTHSMSSHRLLGGVGLGGVAAALATIVALGSSAAPAFAGWSASPTSPQPGALAAASRNCGMGAVKPVLSDARGPYVTLIYANGSTCVDGNGIEIRSDRVGGGAASSPPGMIELNGAGESDSDGHALTMVYGPVGAGVTGVTVARSNGSDVQATVTNGWYLAWWPGSERAVVARVTTASAVHTQAFPSAPDKSTPACPAGARCSSGYGFGSGTQGAARTTSVRASGGDSSGG